MNLWARRWSRGEETITELGMGDVSPCGLGWKEIQYLDAIFGGPDEREITMYELRATDGTLWWVSGTPESSRSVWTSSGIGGALDGSV
jgi:hypothetical protein